MPKSIAKSIEPPARGLIDVLKDRYDCPHFRILIVGRANAGKTTIVEKMCNVKQGTTPTVYDRHGVEISLTRQKPTSSWRRVLGGDSGKGSSILMPSIYRGEHDIEHQITYSGSSFLFHDSRGFEAGGKDEFKIVKKFIKDRSSAAKLKDRLHAIWYCVPMDDPRPLTTAELKFFDEGTGKVPLVVIFTKFDAQIIQEHIKLDRIENEDDRWDVARFNAEKTFQEHYLSLILGTKSAPKAYVKLEHMDQEEASCPELTEKTAGAIDIASLRQLFTSTQMNNLNLCIRDALRDLATLINAHEIGWDDVAIFVMARFPHFWQSEWKYDKELKRTEGKYYFEARGAGGRKAYRLEFEVEALEAKFGERREFAHQFMEALLSLFGVGGSRSCRVDFQLKACQIITALLVILEQSFWMSGSFWEKVDKSFNQFKTQDYVQRLKKRIACLPAGQKELIDFLYTEALTH